LFLLDFRYHFVIAFLLTGNLNVVLRFKLHGLRLDLMGLRLIFLLLIGFLLLKGLLIDIKFLYVFFQIQLLLFFLFFLI